MNYKRILKKFIVGTLIALIWALYCTYFGNVVISSMLLRCLFAGFVLTALSELT